MATTDATTTDDPRTVGLRYFEAVTRRDVAAMVACWAPGGREHVRGMVDGEAPGAVRAFFDELFAAVPDFTFEVLDVVADEQRAAVRWRAVGTFDGDVPFQGIRPTGSRVELEGCDVLTVEEGRIAANDAYTDGMTFARAIGMLPPQGSAPDRAVTRAFNAVTAVRGAVRRRRSARG